MNSYFTFKVTKVMVIVVEAKNIKAATKEMANEVISENQLAEWGRIVPQIEFITESTAS